MDDILTFKTVDISYDTQTAVRGIDFSLHEHEILALIGESGSGKSTIIRASARLPNCGKITRGKILFHGRNLALLSEKEMRNIRGYKIGVAFQDALAAFCPVRTIGAQLYEAISAHLKITKLEAKKIALEIFSKLDLDGENIWDSYPFELSGGMCARAGIAAAVLPHPDVLLADEPTAALDTISKHGVITEILNLRQALGTSVILVTHDMGVAKFADRIIVLKDGEIVENGPAEKILRAPSHPYTKNLLASVPKLMKSHEESYYRN